MSIDPGTIEKVLDVEVGTWIVRISVCCYNGKWGRGLTIAGHHAGIIRGVDPESCVYNTRHEAVSSACRHALRYADHYAENYNDTHMPVKLRAMIEERIVQISLDLR